jgi:hypothetical protein
MILMDGNLLVYAHREETTESVVMEDGVALWR